MLLRLILLFYTLQVADAGLFQYPPLVRAEVGSSVNLTCDIEDMSGKCFSVIWFKLRSTSIPTLETYQSVRPGDSLVGDEIEKTCSLNLNNAQVDDSGTYYCAFIKNQVMFKGNGSTLAVRACVSDADCFPLVWRYVFIPGVLVAMWIHFAVVRWNNNKQRRRFQEER